MDSLLNECQKETEQTDEREWVDVVVKEQDEEKRNREKLGRRWGEFLLAGDLRPLN